MTTLFYMLGVTYILLSSPCKARNHQDDIVTRDENTAHPAYYAYAERQDVEILLADLSDTQRAQYNEIQAHPRMVELNTEMNRLQGEVIEGLDDSGRVINIMDHITHLQETQYQMEIFIALWRHLHPL